MFFKRENLYLFLTLILIISTNIYLTCQLLPKKEGLNVKKEFKKFGKNLEKTIKKDILGSLEKIVITALKGLVNNIPYKPLRRYFLNNVKFKKRLIPVIKDIGSACLKMFITIYFIGGFIFQIIPNVVLPYTPTIIRLIGKALTFIIESLMNILFKGGSQGSSSSLSPSGGMPPGMAAAGAAGAMPPGMPAPGGMPPPGVMGAPVVMGQIVK